MTDKSSPKNAVPSKLASSNSYYVISFTLDILILRAMGSIVSLLFFYKDNFGIK